MLKQPKKIFSLLLLLLCLSFASLTNAAESSHNNLISVDGCGSATAAPDKAVITVGISNFAKDAGDAQQENAQMTASVLDALKAAGVAAADIETRSYNFYPSYNTDNENRIEGYRVNNSLLITVRDINKVGTIIDTALANGANKVNSLNFSLQHPEALRKEALRKAIADARLKADIIADALGVRIAGINLVTENVGSIFEKDATPMLMSTHANKANFASTPIAASDVELSANVHIDYIISQ